MKTLIFTAILLLSASLSAQQLTLFDCYQKAEARHPLQQEIKNRRLLYQLNKKNLTAHWLPEIEVNARAAYMSDVVEFERVLEALPIPLPPGSFQNMPKDQYKASLDVTQTLFDGGLVHAGKLAEKAKLLADEQAVQVQFYKMRDQINHTYFALLMLEKQQELLGLYADQIAAQRQVVVSGVKNGVIIPGDLDALDAELINIQQKLVEISVNKKKLTAILGEFIGESVADTLLTLPELKLPETAEFLRPEEQLFAAQKASVLANKKVITAGRLPKAMLSGSYAYGNPPGNDFFRNEFDTFYNIGAGLSWNIFDWNMTKRNVEALQAQANIINAKQADFDRQIRIALKSANAELERLQALLKNDAKLIELRQRIAEAAASKLKNGVIKAADYLDALNDEREARINFEMHKIQLVQAKANYLTISGQMPQ